MISPCPVSRSWLFDVVAVIQCQVLTLSQNFATNIEAGIRGSVDPPSTPLEALLLDGLIATAKERQRTGKSIITETKRQDNGGSIIAEGGDIPPVVWKAKRLLQERYREDLSYRRIGRELACDPEYLEMRFHKAFGETLHDCLRRTRAEKSFELLQQGEKVEVVALEVGFRSKSGFIRAFRMVTGQAPKAARTQGHQ